jgi:hypothetical protein
MFTMNTVVPCHRRARAQPWSKPTDTSWPWPAFCALSTSGAPRAAGINLLAIRGRHYILNLFSGRRTATFGSAQLPPPWAAAAPELLPAPSNATISFCGQGVRSLRESAGLGRRVLVAIVTRPKQNSAFRVLCASTFIIRAAASRRPFSHEATVWLRCRDEATRYQSSPSRPLRRGQP